MRSQTRILAGALLMLAGASAGRADMAPHYGGWRSRHRPELCAAVQIHSVDSAQIDRRNSEVILTVSGEASSAGWRNASLRRVEPPAQEAGETEAIYEFIACPPEVAVDVLTPSRPRSPFRRHSPICDALSSRRRPTRRPWISMGVPRNLSSFALGGVCLAGVATLAVLAPLATYSVTLAVFGLPHVLSELRYIDRRFGRRLDKRFLLPIAVLLQMIVAVRASVVFHVAPLRLGLPPSFSGSPRWRSSARVDRTHGKASRCRSLAPSAAPRPSRPTPRSQPYRFSTI